MVGLANTAKEVRGSCLVVELDDAQESLAAGQAELFELEVDFIVLWCSYVNEKSYSNAQEFGSLKPIQ